ncbi:cysteine--tRNA ligase [Haladaptatus sp. F3-133]|uniref:Cysteine--tRNA ligase n=1 Tax=Halorutilus salinus TaxID=2487751 RepID=A0A9Q4GFI7_9EURY|nr:cysteine--tRNA ligase [Halorutilus salinus]MCX2818194.1 cysteine--tRNA ligase [Halorutilus salinus]
MTQLRLSNTLSGDTEVFEPLDDDRVLLYVCGLTVSDDPHLGHARTWVSFDVLHRYLEYKGYDVEHVENVTDVDDKIIRRAEEEGKTAGEVAARYAEQVYDDMVALNLRRVDVRPHVTEHVDDIVRMVERLVERGYAYEAEDGVYFDVSEFDAYGKLSGQRVDQLEQGEEGTTKEAPEDFALWKLADGEAPDEEPTWESPWGEGRPGWHIECSAMSTTHLGETIDIHGGGRDLVFPHHENEIAQTEAATGEEFTRYWLHVGSLRVDDEKMSSSLGNFWTVHEALEEYDANEIRGFLLGTRYTKPQRFTRDALDDGAARWERLRNGYRTCEEAMDSEEARAKETDGALRDATEEAREAFVEAMDDDLNTPEALAALDGIVDAVNAEVEEPPYDYAGLFCAWRALDELAGDVLGFDFSRDGDTARVVGSVLALREEMRDEGEYETADALRDALEDAGAEVQDTDDGATYRL